MMKLQRIVILLITCLFLVFFADAVRIEYKLLCKPSKKSTVTRLVSVAARSEDTLNSSFALRYGAYECAGAFNKLTGRRYLDRMYRLDNGHLVSVGGNGNISESVEAMEALAAFCAERELPLLYVNIPKNYIRNEDLASFGVVDETDLKADRFLAELADAGIECLDLRPYILSRYPDPYNAFFKTDHHWKVSAGLYCAQVLSSYLAEHFELPLDPDHIRDENFSVTKMEKSWVGERGKKTGASYSGLDDFELILPKDETHFHLDIPSRKLDQSGDFSIMVDTTRYDADYWTRRYGPSFYYSYLFGNDPIQVITNEDQDTGRILLIKDSFSQTVAPFLALTANTLVTWDVRYNTDSLREYIARNDFDIVIVMYSESMINGTRSGRFMYDFS